MLVQTVDVQTDDGPCFAAKVAGIFMKTGGREREGGGGPGWWGAGAAFLKYSLPGALEFMS